MSSCYLLDNSQLPGSDPLQPGTANVGFSSFNELHGRQLMQPEIEHIFAHGNYAKHSNIAVTW